MCSRSVAPASSDCEREKLEKPKTSDSRRKSYVAKQKRQGSGEAEEAKQQTSATPAALRPANKKSPLIGFDKTNYLLHYYYIQRDFNACKALIKESLDECNELCDYPMYVRGKIAQADGELEEALRWFENALALKPNSSPYLSRIGRVHFLLGNHGKAADVLLRAIEKDPNIAQAYYWRAMALYYGDRDEEGIKKAQECLTSIPIGAQSAEVLSFMAEMCKKKNDLPSAVKAYEQVIKVESDNIGALTNLGLLYYKADNDNKAFDMFGQALSYDPTDGNAIIAAGSIIQAHGDYDVALSKYRVAAEKCNYNGSLWNNIGMCFFGKGKFVAAISCLKKAYYLCPLDYKISYNLGLVHNAVKQYASAYYFLSASINLNPNFVMAYVALAAVLTNLSDAANARKAYEKAMQLDGSQNPRALLNYAIFEAKENNMEAAGKLLKQCEERLPQNSAGPNFQELLSGLESLRRALSQRNRADSQSEQSYV